MNQFAFCYVGSPVLHNLGEIPVSVYVEKDPFSMNLSNQTITHEAVNKHKYVQYDSITTPIFVDLLRATSKFSREP